MLKFNVGDLVTVTENRSGHGFETGEVIQIDKKFNNDDEFEHYGAQSTTRDEYWYLGDAEIAPAAAEVDPARKLTLLKLELVDSKGNVCRVKRSKCRHYYVKFPGSNQRRVSLSEIKDVVAGLTGDI